MPGIPTEADVLKNGMTVGEFQSKLLQKVEELTLYVIQFEKKNDALTERIEHLEKSK